LNCWIIKENLRVIRFTAEIAQTLGQRVDKGKAVGREKRKNNNRKA
jgi:chorismate mutase